MKTSKRLISALLLLAMLLSMTGAIPTYATEIADNPAATEDNFIQIAEDGSEMTVASPENIAQGKSVFAMACGSKAKLAVDGNANTYYYSNTTRENTWLIVDLGEEYLLSGGEITFPEEKACHYKVEISGDMKTWVMASDQSANTSEAKVQTLTFSENTKALYVRVTSLNAVFTNPEASGQLNAAISELKLYGTKTGAAIVGARNNVAHSKTTNASSGTAANVVDGNYGSSWGGNGTEAGQWVSVDLGKPYLIDGCEVTLTTGIDDWDYKIQTSTNGTDWSQDVVYKNDDSTEMITQFTFAAVEAQYWRIIFNASPGGAWTAMNELKIFEALPTLGALSPVVAPQESKILLSAMTGETGDSFYYKKTAQTDAANQPEPDSTALEGWTAFTADTEILGEGGTAIFVQVIRVTDGKIKAWGEATATPTSPLEYTRSDMEPETVAAVKALMKRVAPGLDTDVFLIGKITNKANNDLYEIEYADGKIILRGNQGYSVTRAFNQYLKQYCKVDYAFPKCGDNTVTVPSPLPTEITTELVVSPYRWRWYGNDVESYTTAFYDEADWQNRIDWYAMNGINVYVHYLGWEAVWRAVLPKFNVDAAAGARFCGSPAWCNMNNNASHGEAMTDGMIDNFLSLSKKVSAQARALGIEPAVRMFFGVVPREVREANKTYDGKTVNYVNARMTVPGDPNLYIVPTDPFYKQFSETFFKTQEEVLGFKPKFYSSDFALEAGLPAGIDMSCVNNMYAEMVSYNKDAIWCMTSWSMSASLKDALVKSPYKNNILLLDLESENRQKGPFDGLNYCWSMLQNFGGNNGMGGDLELISTKPAEDYTKNGENGMVGTCMAPEGSETNPIMYQLMADMGWTKSAIPAQSWMYDYIERRYGKTDENAKAAWDILKETVYVGYPGQGPYQTVINADPQLNLPIKTTSTGAGGLARYWGSNKPVYDINKFFEAWPYMVAAAGELADSNGYRYDLVDVTRQVLTDISDDVYLKMQSAYKAKNLPEFEMYAQMFLDLFTDMDRVVGTRTELTLGRWLEKAKSFGGTEAEKWVNDKNVRIANTLWQPKKGQQVDLENYANKQWSGLLEDYNRPRWEILINAMRTELGGGAKVSNQTVYDEEYSYAQEWSKNQKEYAPEGTHDEVAVCTEIFEKYQPILSALYGEDNIAKGKTALASSAGLTAGNAIDGSDSSTWNSSATMGDEWLEVDLGENYALTGGTLNMTAGQKFRVEVSGDEKTWYTVLNRTETPGAATETLALDTIGRYLRVLSPAATKRALSIRELTISGTPTNESYNIALGKTATASNQSEQAALALDNSISNGWSAGVAGGTQWWSVDLGYTYSLSGCQIAFAQASDAQAYKVLISSDGENYTELVSNSNPVRVQNQNFAKGSVGRYVKIEFADVPAGKTAALSECKLYERPLPQNLALNKTVTGNGSTLRLLVDGKFDTTWGAGTPSSGAYAIVDLGGTYPVSALQVVMTTATPDLIWKYKIESSTNNSDWTTVVDEWNTTRYDMKQLHLVQSEGRYYKLTFGQAPGQAWTAALEFSVFGGDEVAVLNKKALQNAINVATMAQNKPYYTPESKALVTAEIGKAKALLASGQITQEAVDTQVTLLNEAVSLLRKSASHSITVDSKLVGGTIIATPSTASVGETVKISIVPAAGSIYKANSIRANNGAVEVKYNRFVMPDEDVMLTAQFLVGLRVATFNIAATKSPNISAQAALLDEHKIDVVGLQEVDKNTDRNKKDMLDELVKAGAMTDAFFQKAIDFGNGEYGIGIASKTPLTEKAGGPLSSPNVQEARAYERAVVTVGDKKVAIYNTHLTWDANLENSIAARAAQISQILELVAKDDTPYKVITGDFNIDQTHDEFYPFLETMNMANGGNGIWYDTFNGTDSTMKTMAIDNIITTRNIAVSNVTMAETALSDHNLFYADLELLEQAVPSRQLLDVVMRDAATYQESAYSAESFAVLSAAIEASKALADTATQAEIDIAVANLREAVKGLKPRGEEQPSIPSDTSQAPAPVPEAPKTDETGNTVVVLPVKPNLQGNVATANVPDSAVKNAIDSAVKEAKKTGGVATVEIKIESPAKTKTVETTLSAKSLSAAAVGNVGGLKISTGVADVSLNRQALTAIADVASSSVKISIAKMENENLSLAQKAQLGADPVFEFSITSGGKSISAFGEGTATVTIPYTLQDGELSDFVVIWLLDDAGKLTPVEGQYADGKVTFTTAHFSRYAIGYLPFTDVKADWAYESIIYTYRAQLFAGVDGNKFAPEGNMSRAMLWTVLHRLSRKETPANTAGATWYASAQAWAIAEGISEGTDPNGEISREQIVAMLYRHAGSPKTTQSELSQFSDAELVSAWASAAMQWAVQTGVITGKDGGTLAPQAHASRAEVAVMLMRYALLK